jgi:methylated-DNA-[protein]-cysteine S-methyltransferase
MSELEALLRQMPDRHPPDLDLDRAGPLLDVAYTTIDSPVGSLLVAGTPRGLVRLAYLDTWTEEHVLEDLAHNVSPRVLRAPRKLEEPRRELEEYFSGQRTAFAIPIDWSLTRGFAQRVLRATAQIPYGTVSSYGQVAARAGSPRAHRAAGTALGHNPIPIVVPCHRVLHAGGGLGGYTGGLERKRYLLGVESDPSHTPGARGE